MRLADKAKRNALCCFSHNRRKTVEFSAVSTLNEEVRLSTRKSYSAHAPTCGSLDRLPFRCNAALFFKFSTFHNKQIIDYIIDYNDRLYIKYKYIYIFLKFIFVFLLLFHNCTCLDLSCNTLKHFFCK